MTTAQHHKSEARDDVRSYVLDFEQIGLRDLGRVGGKNASLGELFRALKPKGVGVLDGFATGAHAYRRLLRERELEARLREIFMPFDADNVEELARRGEAARAAVLETPIPDVLRDAVIAGYESINSISLNPDIAIATTLRIAAAEAKLASASNQ